MSFSGDSEANGLYTLSVLFKKKAHRKQVHQTIHFFYSSQIPAKILNLYSGPEFAAMEGTPASK